MLGLGNGIGESSLYHYVRAGILEVDFYTDFHYYIVDRLEYRMEDDYCDCIGGCEHCIRFSGDCDCVGGCESCRVSKYDVVAQED